MIENNSPALLKNVGSKILQNENPAFRKLMKGSSNLNDSLLSKILFIFCIFTLSKGQTSEIPKIKPEKALKLMHELDLSRSDYIKLSQFMSNHIGQKIFPSYKAIASVKEKCYPHNCDFSESKYRVEPLSIVQHTIDKIVSEISVEQSVEELDEKTLNFKFKYGNNFCFRNN